MRRPHNFKFGTAVVDTNRTYCTTTYSTVSIPCYLLSTVLQYHLDPVEGFGSRINKKRNNALCIIMTYVIKINNIGVSFLRSGNLDYEAFESFKLAVKLMKQMTAKRERRRFVRRRSVTQPARILRAKQVHAWWDHWIPGRQRFRTEFSILHLPSCHQASWKYGTRWRLTGVCNSSDLQFGALASFYRPRAGNGKFPSQGAQALKTGKETYHTASERRRARSTRRFGTQPHQHTTGRTHGHLEQHGPHLLRTGRVRRVENILWWHDYNGCTERAWQQMGYADLETFLLNSIVLSQPSVAAAAWASFFRTARCFMQHCKCTFLN